jgi:hypothetical protein
VVRLRGYGNAINAEAAASVIRAYMDTMDNQQGELMPAQAKVQKNGFVSDSGQTVEVVKIRELSLEKGTQFRQKLPGAKVVKEYAEAYEDEAAGVGPPMPPIQVVRTRDHGLVPYDGFTRIRAKRSLGHATISAVVIDGTLADARRLALGANAHHGIRRDLDTRHAIARAAIEDYWIKPQPEGKRRSIRELMRITGLQHGFLKDKIDEMTGVVRKKERPPAPPAPPVHDEQHEVHEVEGTAPAPDREPGSDDDLGDDDAAPENVAEKQLTPEVKGGSMDVRLTAKINRESVEERVQECPLYAVLGGDKREDFAEAATLYFLTADARASFGANLAAHYRKPQPGRRANLYHYYADSFLRLPHPDDWTRCEGEDGQGCQDARSCQCYGRGYMIREPRRG